MPRGAGNIALSWPRPARSHRPEQAADWANRLAAREDLARDLILDEGQVADERALEQAAQIVGGDEIAAFVQLRQARPVVRFRLSLPIPPGLLIAARCGCTATRAKRIS